MRPDALPENLCVQLSDFVAETMGLHFPPERWADLQRVSPLLRMNLVLPTPLIAPVGF